MKNYAVEIVLAVLLLLALLGFNHWHHPNAPMDSAEVEHYLSILARDTPLPEQEKTELLRHLRAWAEADDGKPVYMLNLMRYYPALRDLPEVRGFSGSPAEANAYYESQVMPILFRVGGYPSFAGSMQGVLTGAEKNTNLITYDPALDNWNSVLVVRYPSRRAFFELISDPEYLKYMPYKLASALVGLVPMNGELILPMLNWALAVLLLLVFLLVAWLRALRRRPGAVNAAERVTQ